MQSRLPSDILAQLKESIAHATGLHFDESRATDLHRALEMTAQHFGYGTDHVACARWLLSSSLTPDQIHVLATHLTVGETYFFRDARAFDALEHHVIPAIIGQKQYGKRHIHAWSAGCCTGEEAYSLAILLSRMTAHQKGWQITIVGTDINSNFLRRARSGLFNQWSFRRTPPAFRKCYFQPAGDGQFEIHSSFRQMVQFETLNLVDEGLPAWTHKSGGVDIILCRNVLMYFNESQAKKTVSALYRAQADNGWLLLGPSDHGCLDTSPYQAIEFEGTTLFRKLSKPPACTPAIAEGPRAEPSQTFDGREIRAMLHTVRPAPIWNQEPAKTAAHTRTRSEYKSPASNARVAMDEPDALAHFARAADFQEHGNLDAASEALRRALFIDPGFVVAHVMQGNLARKRSQFEAAHRHYRTALQLLSRCEATEPIAGSERMCASQLSEIVGSLMAGRKAV
jgi:chemotaxis protein methyltransferase CheR